ncbi:MAG: hypothetical protein ACPKPY_00805 [Nitrososphaeraceae archaeon]
MNHKKLFQSHKLKTISYNQNSPDNKKYALFFGVILFLLTSPVLNFAGYFIENVYGEEISKTEYNNNDPLEIKQLLEAFDEISRDDDDD